jgi:hypothetical protein
VVLFVTAALLGCFIGTAVADCGKMIIVRRPVVRILRPVRPFVVVHTPRYVPVVQKVIVPNYGQSSQVQQQQQVILNNANNNVVNLSSSGSVPPPPPASGGAVAYGDKAFLEGAQQAVIAWNGKTDDSGEQTLILTTNETSNTGEDMAMLSVLPLPGKPKSIEKANAKVFVQTKLLLDKKIMEQNPASGGAVGFGVMMTQKIGSHNIFVWEMEDISTFKDDVCAYIENTYEGAATALVTDKAIEIIKAYHARGFRYFAFDLTEVKKDGSTKEAIAYRFESKFAYYPLAISGIGGTGHGLIDIIVMTPGEINLGGAFEQAKEGKDFLRKGNATVDFTLAEVKELDPSLAGVFDGSGLNSLRVRNFLIEADDIGAFKNDFIATAVK